jgi:hypothetical protein
MKSPARPPILLLVILALGMKASRPTAALGADCLYECEGPICADYGNHASFCVDLRANCQARCSGRRWWGAIAYSAKDKGYGYSMDWNDVNDAKKEAMRRCAVQGTACKLWVYFENECGAVAADGNTVTWGTAYLKEDAQRKALAECRKAGGRNCAIQAWACSKF